MYGLFKKMLSLVLAIVLLTQVTLIVSAASEAPEAKSLPTNRLAGVEYVAQHYSDGYYSVMLEGYYKVPVTLGSATSPVRDIWMYIPEDSGYSQPTVFVITPNGYGNGVKEPYDFLVESGWKDVSDEKKITIVLLAPNEFNGNVWGDYSAEKQYLIDSYDYIEKRPFIFTCEYNKYVAAYGEGADVGTKFAMSQGNKSLAGALVVGAFGIDSDYVQQMQTTDSLISGVKLSEVPVPMWIVAPEKTDDVARLVDYWKNANDTEAVATPSALADEYYAPDQDADIGQPDSEAVAAVYYTTTATADAVNSEFAELVWENLFKGIRRYPTFGNWGLRSYTPMEELGAQLHWALVPGGKTSTNVEYDVERNWYVYVPDSVDASKQNPVLFLFCGRSGFNTEIASRTGWQGFCEQEGVILVALAPSIYHRNESKNGMIINPVGTTWNTSASVSNNIYMPNDLLFVDYVRDWLLDGVNGYADIIDASKFYVSGQSMGGSFTHGVIANRPQSFAAAAPFSWVATPGATANLSVDIPVINIMGQKDTTVANAFAGSSGSSIFSHFINRYGLADKDGKNSYDQFTYMREKNTNNAETSVCTENDGLMNKYIFNTPNGYPMFEAVEVIDMIHATMPSILPEAWNFMKNYSRDPATGILYYGGEVVDTPVNLALAAKAYPLSLTTTAHNVKAGDYFTMNATFTEKQSSNAAILTYTFDGDKFEYANFTPADGVQVVNTEYDKGSAKITLISMNYDMETFGDIMLRAKEGAELAREFQTVSLAAEYVLKDESGNKEILTANASARFTTLGNGTIEPVEPGDTNDDGVVDLIDLSNMIDWFGTTSGDADWETLYTFFDFNNNGEIDINDISYVARLIK